MALRQVTHSSVAPALLSRGDANYKELSSTERSQDVYISVMVVAQVLLDVLLIGRISGGAV